MYVWPVLGDHRCLFRAVARGMFDPYNRVPRTPDGEPLDEIRAHLETRQAVAGHGFGRRILAVKHMKMNRNDGYSWIE